MNHATTIRSARVRPRTCFRGQRTVYSVLLFAAFLVVVYFAVPKELPIFFQRLVGLVNALLAMVAAMFAVREHAKSYNRLRVPGPAWLGLGRVHTATWVGVLAFAVTFLWWCSDLAPIRAL